jgi:flagellar protein FlaJ
MEERIPLMFLPEGISKRLVPYFRGVGEKLLSFFKKVEDDLPKTNLKVTAKEYMALAFLNASFFGVLMLLLVLFLFLVQEIALAKALVGAIGIGFGIFFMFMILYSRFPEITAKKKASLIENELVFALKDLSLQMSAGVTLYEGFISISHGNYGEVSEEFKRMVQEINSGHPMMEVIEKMALKSESDYMKRTAWQLVNALKSGSDLKRTLKRIIKELSNEQRTRIINYSRELNLWSLLYMLFAVAVPSIGSTMLVILSSFAGFGITRGLFIAFIVISMIIQYVLIGFVKSRRPVSSF